MQYRYSIHPKDFKKYDTSMIREHLLIENLFEKGKLNLVYSHDDRFIVGGAVPEGELELNNGKELGHEYFLQRREMGIINIGHKGIVVVDDEEYELENKDGLYIGMGAKKVVFKSVDKENEAKFYINSTPAHTSFPNVKIEIQKANPVKLGDVKSSNKRVIYQYVHPKVLKSCQLLMGLTEIQEGCVWNTMPCHTHERRMEVYLYFNLDENSRVFHFLGQPHETRHIVVANEQAVISPSWSIHSGVGTKNYTFIWGMAGENQNFDDMDVINIENLR